MQANFDLFSSEGGKIAGEIFRLGISLGQMEQGKGGGGRGELGTAEYREYRKLSLSGGSRAECWCAVFVPVTEELWRRQEVESRGWR